MTWLRPVSFGVEVKGVDIVGGPELAVMQFLAKRMPDFEHKFESYPLKRNWHLIKNSSREDNVYCFYGASKNLQRQQWGEFSLPTTILLPYPIVALKDNLAAFEQDGYVSVKDLFDANLKTVLFDGAVNVWTEVVQKYGHEELDYLRFNVGHTNAEKLTTELLKSRRVDFAYVGSGNTEIRALEQDNDVQFSVYSIKEFENKARQGHRVMCSKSPLGIKAVTSLNTVLASVLKDPSESKQFCELNFHAVGYHNDMRAVFNSHWPSLLEAKS